MTKMYSYRVPFIASFLAPILVLGHRQSYNKKAKGLHMSLGKDTEGSQEVHVEKYVGLEWVACFSALAKYSRYSWGTSAAIIYMLVPHWISIVHLLSNTVLSSCTLGLFSDIPKLVMIHADISSPCCTNKALISF